MGVSKPNHPVGDLNPDGLPLGGYSKKKAKAFAISTRRAQVSKLFLQEYPAYQIADMLNVTRDTIYKDISILMKKHVEFARANMDEKILRMVMKFEYLANYAWRRLEQIKNPSAGSKWGEEIRKNYMEIAKLQGLYPSAKIDVNHTATKISKSQRDAVAEAAINTANSTLKLLPPMEKNGTDSQ